MAILNRSHRLAMHSGQFRRVIVSSLIAAALALLVRCQVETTCHCISSESLPTSLARTSEVRRLARRSAVFLTLPSVTGLPRLAGAADPLLEEPLLYCGGGFCITFRVDGRLFRGVLDTGSPFILVSTCSGGAEACQSYCRIWGCTTPFDGKPSGLGDTDEIFAAGSARVAWRQAAFSLGQRDIGEVIYGAMLPEGVQSYGGNGGGAFLGLVRDKTPRIRPTLLGQTAYRTIVVDLQKPGKEQLSLSVQPLPAAKDAVPLVDLRPWGAPVSYYAVEVSELKFGGESISWPGRLVAVLDTGTTGLGLPKELFELYDDTRRSRAMRGLPNSKAVELTLAMESGTHTVLQLQQGRISPYNAAFDIVTSIPEAQDMSVDAAALWTVTAEEALDIRGAIALPQPGRVGWSQADRYIGPGESYTVRLVPAGLASGPCDVAIALSQRGSPRWEQDSEGAAMAYTSGSIVNGVHVGSLFPGDTVECGLTEESGVYWRINGGPPTSAIPLGSLSSPFPTVEAGPHCGVELQRTPGGRGQWASLKSRSESPTVMFLGLGFILGQSLSIDAVARRAMFNRQVV
mmetsp:Transcript_14914/g.32752  ORF Transcript_14914/g.32752 Transcript_14914/m.32752 type:complete len:572 (-) Transcript_14914:8-1723(-)